MQHDEVKAVLVVENGNFVQIDPGVAIIVTNLSTHKYANSQADVCNEKY